MFSCVFVAGFLFVTTPGGAEPIGPETRINEDRGTLYFLRPHHRAFPVNLPEGMGVEEFLETCDTSASEKVAKREGW